MVDSLIIRHGLRVASAFRRQRNRFHDYTSGSIVLAHLACFADKEFVSAHEQESLRLQSEH